MAEARTALCGADASAVPKVGWRCSFRPSRRRLAQQPRAHAERSHPFDADSAVQERRLSHSRAEGRGVSRANRTGLQGQSPNNAPGRGARISPSEPRISSVARVQARPLRREASKEEALSGFRSDSPAPRLPSPRRWQTRLPVPPRPALSFPPGYYDAAGRLRVKALTWAELRAWCAGLGEDSKRAEQLWRWTYHHYPLVHSLDEHGAARGSNAFSAWFRERFRGLGTLEGGLALEVVEEAPVLGTPCRVLRFELDDLAAPRGAERRTARRARGYLLSTARREGDSAAREDGCRLSPPAKQDGLTLVVGCSAEEEASFSPLSAAQIVEQVIEVKRLLFHDGIQRLARDRLADPADPWSSSAHSHSSPQAGSNASKLALSLPPRPDLPRPQTPAAAAALEALRLRNVVFSGPGDPLADPRALLTALGTLCDGRGLNLAPSRLHVRTAGSNPVALAALASRFPRVHLRIALASTAQVWEGRENGRHGTGDSAFWQASSTQHLVRTLERVFPMHAAKLAVDQLLSSPARKIPPLNIEVLLQPEVNDEVEHAAALVRLLRRVRYKLTVLQAAAEGESLDAAEKMARVARAAGVVAAVRRPRLGDSCASSDGTRP